MASFCDFDGGLRSENKQVLQQLTMDGVVELGIALGRMPMDGRPSTQPWPVNHNSNHRANSLVAR